MAIDVCTPVGKMCPTAPIPSPQVTTMANHETSSKYGVSACLPKTTSPYFEKNASQSRKKSHTLRLAT